MAKVFNINADCKPGLHYMVDVSGRLKQIKSMVDAGDYFTINRARQYGKTTVLRALEKYLKPDYLVVSIDFQKLSYADFESEQSFSEAFSAEVLDAVEDGTQLPGEVCAELEAYAAGKIRGISLSKLFRCLNRWCRQSEKKIVLIVDEVDSASNNQVFLDFLAQLRAYYIDRDRKKTFHSVILAGVYDIKNLKRKFADNDVHKRNSPWNIAADFLVDMSFSMNDIQGMLDDYESDYHVGMHTKQMAKLLYAYTDGYPYLVSALCRLMDESPDQGQAWTKAGFLKAVRTLLGERNMLFDSLTEKLSAYPQLEHMIKALLFQGKKIAYNPDDEVTGMALMFGFAKTDGSFVSIANRIFEIRLYNLFLTVPQVQENGLYQAAVYDQNQFVEHGRLNMRLVLEKFVSHFHDLYAGKSKTFYEEDGRRYFLLYLRPMINGSGNYYVETQTRDHERTDVIVDYHGEQFVIEMKIWRGNAYHVRGEQQLLDYLEYYHLEKGYLLSFNFNKNKTPGVREVRIGDKLIIEAVV